MFVFRAPQNHQVFARPCRAAEASLKTELLHSSDILVTPSGHCGDICAFSSSLEYMFVEDSRPPDCQVGPLAALTNALRTFTGDPQLIPLEARASAGGGVRRGRKRLRPWRGPLGPTASSGPAATASATAAGERAEATAAADTGIAALAGAGRARPAAALRSRAKRARLGATANGGGGGGGIAGGRPGGTGPQRAQMAFLRRSV